MATRLTAFSMRRALGGGPQVLALALATVWLSGTVALPLGHALLHGGSGGHCHGAVCHDLASGASDGSAVRDGSLPDRGSLALSHGAALALAPIALALVPPRLALVAAAELCAPLLRWESRRPRHAPARAPPQGHAPSA